MSGSNRRISWFPYPLPAGPSFFGSAPKERGERKPRPSGAGRLSSREDRAGDALWVGPPTGYGDCSQLRCLCRTREGVNPCVLMRVHGGHGYPLWRSRERPQDGLTGECGLPIPVAGRSWVACARRGSSHPSRPVSATCLVCASHRRRAAPGEGAPKKPPGANSSGRGRVRFCYAVA